MSCPHCPHCTAEKGEQKGEPKGAEIMNQKGEDIDSGSGDSESRSENTKSANPPLFDPNATKRGRGKALVYSGAFEVAWRSYGRKEEKLRAFKEWLLQAPSVGGENRLLQLILTALRWQGPRYAADGWRYARYFERYLRGRRWEDEPLPAPEAPRPATKAIAAAVVATDAKLSDQRQREAAMRLPTLDELQRLRNGGTR